MSDSWLDSGHGDGRSLAPVRSVPAAGPTEGPRSSAWRSRSGRTFVAVVAAAAVIGSAGTAYAIRETLFPNIGAPTSRSVWQNPVPIDEPVAVTATTGTSSTTSTTTSTTMPSTSDDSTTPIPSVALTPNPDGGDDAPSVTDDSGGSGHGSDDSTTDDSTTDDPATDDADADDSGSDVDNSGSGSGADDSSGSGGSGSDDGVDDLDD